MKSHSGSGSSFLLIGLFIESNLVGYLMIGPFSKFRNISASKVANSLVSKMNSDEDGIFFLDFDDFKKL